MFRVTNNTSAFSTSIFFFSIVILSLWFEKILLDYRRWGRYQGITLSYIYDQQHITEMCFTPIWTPTDATTTRGAAVWLCRDAACTMCLSPCLPPPEKHTRNNGGDCQTLKILPLYHRDHGLGGDDVYKCKRVKRSDCGPLYLSSRLKQRNPQNRTEMNWMIMSPKPPRPQRIYMSVNHGPHPSTELLVELRWTSSVERVPTTVNRAETRIAIKV